ncbi:MAG: dipeptide ABC transporter ATP-binding protein [Pseudomonadota bacterium]
MSLLCVDDLKVSFTTPTATVEAVRDLSFRLERNESLGIVGESGSGKSQAMSAILGLLAENGSASGSVRLEGEEILNLPETQMRQIRGRRIAVVFQDPMTSLNPYVTIGYQLRRVLVEQRGLDMKTADAEIVRMLDAVRLPAASSRLNSYPHEYSGGMRQRVMIAAAMLCRPDVLIADEPTTALDVTVQSGILGLLLELQEAFHTAMVLISHDLGVVSGVCDQLLVLHQGEMVEQGATAEVFAAPQAQTTQALLAAVPRLDRPLKPRQSIAPTRTPLLEAYGIRVRYPLPRPGWFGPRQFTAVRDVDLSVMVGETVGIVGESGCGKSSLARGLLEIGKQSGELRYRGEPCHLMDRESRMRMRRDVQFVFQNPLGSLNPRMTILDIVSEPLLVHGLAPDAAERRRRVVAMLERVGLDASMLLRYPHEFSGGQCQRIGIARALMTHPRLLICDEAVSALDVTVQADILSLLSELQKEFGLGVLFISHDLAVIRDVSDQVVVMYLGRIVERAPVASLYSEPQHPYTQALLAAAPVPDPEVERSRKHAAPAGDLPAPWNPLPGCPYRSRCTRATETCEIERPELKPRTEAHVHWVACHHPSEASSPPVAEASVSHSS